jgi:uncharacterized membrane protein
MPTQRGFDRVVNLSDAVVAIAATLLVLPLVDTASSIDDSTLGELLAENASELTAFVLSFAVIFRFWLLHHALFARLRGFSTPMLLVNVVWMLGIAFLPFPTELVAFSGAHDPGVSALYIGTMLVTTVASTVQQWLASRSPELHAEPGDRFGVRGSLVATATMVVALLIAVVLPAVGLWALALLVPSGFVDGRLGRGAGRPIS